MKLNKTLIALAAGASFGLSGQAFSAASYTASTAAGTAISNTVTLGYTVNSVPQSLDSDLEFKVDNKVDLNVTAQDSTTVKITPNGPIASQYYVAEYVIRNDGNSSQGYKFTATDMADTTVNTGPNVVDSSDTATTSSFKIYVDSATGAVGSFDAANDTDSFVGTVAPGGTATVFLVVDNNATVADTLVDGDIAVVNLSAITLAAGATAASDPALTDDHEVAYDKDTVQIVFADTDNNGLESDTTAFEVQTASFTDPNNASNPAVLSVKAINDFICKGSAVVASDNTDYSLIGTPGANTNPNKCADIDATPATDYIPKSIPGSQVQFTYEAKNTGSLATSDASFTKTIGALYAANSLANVTAKVNTTDITAIVIDGTDNKKVTVTLGAISPDDVITITFTAIVE